MIDVDNICLGKHLGVVEDPRTLKASDILPALPKVPKTHRIARTLKEVPMFANDRLGDCTQASKAHAVLTMERSSGQREVALTDDDVIAAYSRVGGYVPGDDSTDNGAYELDSLNDWRTNGIGREKDGTPHTIYAFARVDETDHDEVRGAHYVFNGLKVCAGLPLSARDQLRQGQAWDLVSGPRAKFGSWGGHSMYSFGWTADGLLVWTWGEPQLMTWRWIDAYADECYAVISEDAVRGSGTTQQGFNVQALERYLEGLR